MSIAKIKLALAAAAVNDISSNGIYAPGLGPAISWL